MDAAAEPLPPTRHHHFPWRSPTDNLGRPSVSPTRDRYGAASLEQAVLGGTPGTRPSCAKQDDSPQTEGFETKNASFADGASGPTRQDPKANPRSPANREGQIATSLQRTLFSCSIRFDPTTGPLELSTDKENGRLPDRRSPAMHCECSRLHPIEAARLIGAGILGADGHVQQLACECGRAAIKWA